MELSSKSDVEFVLGEVLQSLWILLVWPDGASMNIEDMNVDELRMAAWNKKLRNDAMKSNVFRFDLKDMKPLTEKERRKMEIETQRDRRRLAKMALRGELDHYDPDWD